MRAVIFSPRARRQFLAGWTWWRRHRDKAPDAFEDDIAGAVENIADSPFEIGAPVRAKAAGLRRAHLPRIRYYLYYRVGADGAIEVIALWHASRRPPTL